MKIQLRDGLPFVAVALISGSHRIVLDQVLLDTGSAGTIFPIDQALALDLRMEAHDTVHRIHGVGGSEFVFTKRVDQLQVGEFGVNDFEIEVGAMNYGPDLNGIVGTDFLIAVGAVIDLADMEIYAGTRHGA